MKIFEAWTGLTPSSGKGAITIKPGQRVIIVGEGEQIDTTQLRPDDHVLIENQDIIQFGRVSHYYDGLQILDCVGRILR